jgi:hypothetical protein
MQPRFILKTHTEALRPGNYSILISKCTSPFKSNYQDRIEKNLTEYLDKSVARFTVLTATESNRGFNFLTNNMLWTWKAHLISAVLIDSKKSENIDIKIFFSLSKIEQITFFKFYLETEGAIILKISEKMMNNRLLTYNMLKEEIFDMFINIYEDYLEIATELKDRLKIKDSIKQIKNVGKDKGGYDSSTLGHKIKPHLQALSDLKLISIKRDSSGEWYEPIFYDNENPMNMTINHFPNIKEMEKKISESSDIFFVLINDALNLKSRPYSNINDSEILEKIFLFGCKLMQDTSSGLIDIDAIIDWCRIKLLSDYNILVKEKDIREFFEEFSKRYPLGLRFHIDSKGKIGYLIVNQHENTSQENP